MGDNIYVDGRYLQQNPDWGKADAAFKTAFISKLLMRNNVNPRHIVDIGTGSGEVLKLLANTPGVEDLTGYDISPQAIEIAQRERSEKLKFYQEDVLQRSDYHADLLLVIDVLEHVDDFYRMLRTIRERSDYFVFHIPLDLCCRTLLKPHVLRQQRQAVGHIHYFSREMVEWMLIDTGYSIVDCLYTGSETDRGLHVSFRSTVKKALRKISFSLSRELSVKLWGGYSMMILAK